MAAATLSGLNHRKATGAMNSSVLAQSKERFMSKNPVVTPPDRSDPLHPAHDAVPLNAAPTEIIAEWPAGTFLENLAPGIDGKTWFVTSPTDRAVYGVSPDKSVHTAARFEGTPTGIVSHPRTGTLTAVGTQGQPDWRLYRLTAAGADVVCDLRDVLGANGMAWVGDQLLVVDSPRSLLVTVDVVTGAADTWLHHPLLTPADAGSSLPGINGLTVHAGYVVMTSSDRGLILKVPAASRHPGDEIEVVAERLVGDDLAAAPDGRLFIATHIGNASGGVLIRPDGVVGWRSDGIPTDPGAAVSSARAHCLAAI
jgi:hypothetical protein